MLSFILYKIYKPLLEFLSNTVFMSSVTLFDSFPFLSHKLNFKISSADGLLAGQNDSHNQTVETKSLAENEDQNDTDVNVFLCVSAHTRITSHANAQTGSKRRETTAQASAEMTEAIVAIVLPAFAARNQSIAGAGAVSCVRVFGETPVVLSDGDRGSLGD